MVERRSGELDIIRSFAAIIVVLFHVLECSVKHDSMISDHMQLVVTSITSTMRWHVPVFFMLTGYLWLNDKKECKYCNVRANITRFLFVLFTIGFTYAIMERFFVTRSVSVALLIGGLLDVLNGDLWDHMWYLYAIIGVYLILPVAKPFFSSSSVKSIKLFVGILFLFSIVFPIMYKQYGYEMPIEIPTSTPVFYTFAGGLIAKKEKYSRKSAIVSSVFFGISVSCVFIIGRFFREYADWISVFSCISAISIFIAFISIFSSIQESVYLCTFSECTFGIYLFHPFFINLMIKVLHIYPLRSYPLFCSIVACIGTIGLSFAITYGLRRIYWIKKFLL